MSLCCDSPFRSCQTPHSIINSHLAPWNLPRHYELRGRAGCVIAWTHCQGFSSFDPTQNWQPFDSLISDLEQYF